MSPIALICFVWAIVTVEIEPFAGLAFVIAGTLFEFARLGGVGADE